jgi:ABC-type transport system involved in cytochrome c biogenesis permease subunit
MTECLTLVGVNCSEIILYGYFPTITPSTFDHRTLRTRLPVRSALFKQRTGGLVVRWVTTGESPLLNVFDYIFFFACTALLG